MTSDEHDSHLGKLLGNLQSLEFILRAYLQKYSIPTPIATTPIGTSFYTLPIGTELPENEITNYDSLGVLIDKFNNMAKSKGIAQLDKKIVDIRDLLAHGRISSLTVDMQILHLIKFSRPNNGTVKIIFNEVMTKEWFKENIRLVYNSIIHVGENFGS
jgi:hypothetical protein